MVFDRMLRVTPGVSFSVPWPASKKEKKTHTDAEFPPTASPCHANWKRTTSFSVTRPFHFLRLSCDHFSIKIPPIDKERELLSHLAYLSSHGKRGKKRKKKKRIEEIWTPKSLVHPDMVDHSTPSFYGPSVSFIFPFRFVYTASFLSICIYYIHFPPPLSFLCVPAGRQLRLPCTRNNLT